MKKNAVIVENILNSVIDEFKFTEEYANMCKALISAEEDFKAGIGNNKELLDLCIDVIYHNNMKAFGLHQLILLYIQWEKEKNKDEEEI